MGYLQNQFKKATLSVVLATSLMGGMGLAQNANAQTVPVGGGQVYSQQVEQGGQQYHKPWENDRTYQAQLQATERTTQSNIRQARANEKAQIAAAQQRYAGEVQREANWAAQLRSNPKSKWSDWSALAAHQNSASANLNSAQVNAHERAEAYIAGQEANYENYVMRLDQQYERMPQYKVQNPFTGANATKPAATQPTGVQLPAANQALTPQQQHDRMVRLYQEAEAKAASSGGKIAMPKPEDFRLDPKDPQINYRGPGGL